MKPASLNRRSAHDLAHFDRNDEWSAARAWSRRRLCGDFVCAFGPIDVHDPVAGEEFLRFGKWTISHGGCSVLSDTHDSRLARRREALRTGELSRLDELLVQAMHEGDVRFEIVRRPAVHPVAPVPSWRVHHQ